ncbi:glycosyltransferase [Gluconacetobacter aggeris]|uniref:Glycosyltransferase n=1 Tax=Gluconacetobacter aggeris TaxID=1286186 RepID=A0A7W4IRJ5_9PROT|nr:glycosyltransferase [Gluconacetobacter aggeris]MBB2167644.1 glycosyltransferase [Gluconacetobacter aggeris]
MRDEMGELIRLETPENSIAFSGERFSSAIAGQIETEHYHRYLLARTLCHGKAVLDVASGEGYGSALLAQVASSVTGVEIDAASVIHATREYRHANLAYLQGDALALPLPDGSIDVAVSFETLEHLADQHRFLGELKRVLRPDGLLVISTPDRNVYSPPGAPPNPYHVAELSTVEFRQILAGYFPNMALLAQKPVIGSAILSQESGVPLVFERQGKTHFAATDHLPAAPYLIAFASAGPLPDLPNSLYIDRSDLDTDRDMRAAAESAMVHMRGELESARQDRDRAVAAQADATLRERAEADRARTAIREAAAREHAAQMTARATIAEYEHALRHAQEELSQLRANLNPSESPSHLEAAEAARASHEAEIAARQRIIDDLSRSLAMAEGRLQAIESSSIWRGSAPVRHLVGRSPRFARATRILLKAAWWTLTGQLAARLRAWRRHRAMRHLSDHSAGQAKALPLLAAMPDFPIRLVTSATPRVSVIIPTYGQDDYTLRCLASIAMRQPRTSIEVIVMDDAYPARQDHSFLQDRVEGAHIIRNPENLGFLKTCNAAARQARGDYLFFLNNDTELMPGAIDALADLLAQRPDIGMTGSKLVYPNGQLQEAGGIIWQDASGWNWGRNQDPSRPEYNYRRSVDYISGAAIMIRRDLFETLGGFDTAFSPAYYEDTDLAFRVRETGAKVVYEPRSVVVHYEGISHGTDIATGVKAHQAVNAKLMRTRWASVLDRLHFHDSADLLRASDQAHGRKIILVVDHYVPEPDRDAGSRTIMGVLSSLVDAGWVVKFWPQNRFYSPIYTPLLQDMGIEVLDHRWPGDLRAWLAERGNALDCVLVSRPSVANDLLPMLFTHKKARMCFYGHDLHFERMQREAALTGDADLMRAAESMKAQERQLWRMFDTSIYLSQDEALTARQLEPYCDFRVVVPYCFRDFRRRERPTAGSTILFVAGFAHPPNVDAAIFLVREILPLILAERPDARVLLVGSHPAAGVKALAGPAVTVTGWVSDAQLHEHYDTSRAAVVPLRFGAGVKGKVVEALYQGVPLTVTPIGAEGIAGLADILPIVRSPREIADDLLHMLNDDTAWLARSHAQTRFAQDHFSAKAMQDSVIAALA